MTAQNYARRHASCEPTFHPVKRQSNPNRMSQDLGVEMRWGAPGHVARLYRNVRDHAPYTFTFDHVVIHEEDAPEEFDYQPSVARKTPVGMFYPLSAYMLELYRSCQTDRNIFSALAELDTLRRGRRALGQGDASIPPNRHLQNLETKHVGVMVGEFGAYNKTPYPVALCWMKDYVDLWPAAGWGWAIWNSTGPMGIIDSDRADVEYENWHSHKVAREMLTLAQGWKAGLSLTAVAVSGAKDLFQSRYR